MPFSKRFNRSMETEIREHLIFTSSVEQALDQEGVRITYIKVRLRNTSLATLTNIRGTITPTSCSAFRRMWFRIRSLDPRQEVEIAAIPARVYQMATTDTLAYVDFTSQADLSFRFAEARRALNVVTPSSLPSASAPASRGSTPARSTSPWRGALPLSPVTRVQQA